MLTGSLQIKNGKYYTVVNLPCREGKYQKKYEPTGLTEKGNKRKAEALLQERIAFYSDNPVQPTKILFCDFIAEWVRAGKSGVQVTTHDVYVHMLNKHIFPYFKNTGLLIDQVKPLHIQQYYTAKIEEGLNPNTVIKHHGIIRTSLQSAIKQGIIKENAADLVDKPKRKRFITEYYNQSEINQLFEAVKGTSIEVPVLLASFFGLRRSECLGLRWDSVDFTNNTVSINHKVVRAKVNGKITVLQTDDLKTQSSYRILPLETQILEYLKRLKQKQEENKSLFGNGYSEKYIGYICVNEIGDLLKPDYVSDKFGKILDKAGLKHIRFHDLRHSCASLLLSLGYSMKDIQEFLGHSNFQTTANIYAHIDPKNKRNMINSVSGALSIKL